MKGYGAIKINQPGWIEKERPTAGPLDAIIRPTALAPCSSDIHVIHGGFGEITDRIVGHEAVGEVVEVGNLVKNFQPGDKVVIPCTTPDWEAVSLQDRNINNAHDFGLMKSFKFLSQKDGVFAEFFHVNNADANLVHMPENVSVEDALMTVDMMSTGFYGVENAEVSFGDTVVIFGIGPVGLMAVAGTALRGAGKIIAIGTRPNCVELAKEFGATDIVSYKDGDVVEQILAMGGKVDKVILAGGNCSTMNQALALVKPNGIISNMNFLDVKDKFDIPAALWALGMGDITIRSGFCPGGARRIERLLEIIKAGRCHPGKLLNKKYTGFSEIENAYKIMEEKPRDLIKPYVVIDWDKE
ncbi:MAG: zinc-binding dehydrogenase [Enterococcaceae bacterium]|jgi:threonine dehydrogenase-like Zn-dependent dehydrogenase|nr:zinc-binding dehydrogenase [Enterococcaceae bacterium]MCI1919592.1 zinc-binding dehydrogenase [Enterococcaceae bacterium]